MKKIFYTISLLALIILMPNCSRDDDGPSTPSGTNNLYGTWNLDYYINNSQLVEEIVCNEQVTYVFSSNGSYSKTTFAGEGSTNCDVAVILKGKWENLGDNIFQLTPNGSTGNENLDITFQDNFTKFTITYGNGLVEVFSK
ncbi:MAG: hypothetical protein WBM98_13835 [Maribacter sp.]|uniref:hypothetical protein n=1 Tax=Maribacter sp. TaxID=1897614 RepID=UPI003C730CA0